MKNKLFAKLLSATLSLLMVVSCMVILPFTATADVSPTVGWKVSDGISSVADMLAFAAKVASDNTDDTPYLKGETVELKADIDMSGVNWTPMATFSGTLDGKGYAIKNITFSELEYAGGLCKTADGATFKNLQLLGFKVSTTSQNHAGAICAKTYGDKVVFENLYLDVEITAANNHVGGIVGIIGSKVEFTSVAVTGKVSGGGGVGIGGFYGIDTHESETVMTDCIFFGDVNATTTGQAAGLVGKVVGELTMTRCINLGDVTDSSAKTAGLISLYSERAKSWDVANPLLTENPAADVSDYVNDVILVDCYTVSPNNANLNMWLHANRYFSCFQFAIGYTGESGSVEWCPFGTMANGCREAAYTADEVKAIAGMIKTIDGSFDLANYPALSGWCTTGDKTEYTDIGNAKNVSMPLILPESVAKMIGKYISQDAIYKNYTCVEELPMLLGQTVVMDAYNNDAIDSYHQDTVTALADGTALSLKLSFAVPRTFLKFGFKVETAGTYDIAIEYNGTVSNDNQIRILELQVDELGREQITVTPVAKGYLIVSLNLEAGDHTLTLYAPENVDTTNSEGIEIKVASVISYKAWKHFEVTTHGLTMQEGAAVRMTEQTALRFTTNFSKSYYDLLVSTYGEENLEFGMLITPAAYLMGMSEISIETLYLLSAPYVEYKATLRQMDNGDYYYYGVIEVAEADYATAYGAVSYVKIKESGSTTVTYARFYEKYARSVNDVAASAVADTVTASAEGYTNEITVDGATVYSPYKAAAYDLLKKLLPKVTEAA